MGTLRGRNRVRRRPRRLPPEAATERAGQGRLPFARPAVLVAAAALAMLSCAPRAADEPAGNLESQPPLSQPNILFLFADDQRADTIGAWGNDLIDTPNLDRIVAEGWSFRRNYVFGSNSGAVCVPSRAMVLTGRSWMRSPNRMEGVPTLPRLLEAGGYRTFITGKWHNGEEALLRSFDRGTAVYLGGMADHTRTEVQDIENGGMVRRRVGETFSSELFADAVIEFLDERGLGRGTRRVGPAVLRLRPLHRAPRSAPAAPRVPGALLRAQPSAAAQLHAAAPVRQRRAHPA